VQSIQRKISELLRDALGRINGFALEGGMEVRSSVTQLDQVVAIVTPGSRIEIRGELRFSTYRQSILSAVRITNLDSNQTTSLPAPVCLSKPGMLLHATPTTTASLAPPNVGNGKDGVSDAGSGVTIL
jgi:hypothetical protein